MYSVNGFALDNPTFDWVFRAESKPLSEYTRRASTLRVPGVAGVATVPAVVDAPILPLVVQTPRIHLETLLAIFLPGGLLSVTANPSRVAAFECLSTGDYEGTGPADEVLDITFMIRLNEAFWRSASTTISTAVTLTSSIALSLFPGMSAPISDGILRLTGPFNSLAITDSDGDSAIRYSPNVAASECFLYDLAQQTATVAPAGSWSGGTDVSGVVDFTGPRLNIDPYYTIDPSVRVGRLRITAVGTGAGSKVEFQGRGSYLV